MNSNVVLAVFTDGRRDCLTKTLASADERLLLSSREDSLRIIFDDSGILGYGEWLRTKFGSRGYEVFCNGERLGFGGNIRRAWMLLAAAPEKADYIFHLEDDFTFNQFIDVSTLAGILGRNPHLAQIALRRQPWNEQERAAGGVVEQYPDAYKDCEDEFGNKWLEHRLFFTSNPSLYRRQLIVEHEWPDVQHSEGIFTHTLLKDPDVRFAFYGARSTPPLVEHIGVTRVGSGY